MSSGSARSLLIHPGKLIPYGSIGEGMRVVTVRSLFPTFLPWLWCGHRAETCHPPSPCCARRSLHPTWSFSAWPRVAKAASTACCLITSSGHGVWTDSLEVQSFAPLRFELAFPNPPQKKVLAVYLGFALLRNRVGTERRT